MYFIGRQKIKNFEVLLNTSFMNTSMMMATIGGRNMYEATLFIVQ
jgi:hypothetical protein